RRHKKPHAHHPLDRAIERAPGPVRVLGISTTVMDPAYHVARAGRKGSQGMAPESPAMAAAMAEEG
ncbi:MAG TPA: hypothetical protein VGQ28_04905, partial [Thermoanaerobaculia bacterium]|nr:hypothetical protein [Thermoanaerobaculia bacterium]